MLRERPRGWVPHDDVDASLVASVNDAVADMTRRNLIGATRGEAGARTARHPLASLGINVFNDVRFPGLGDGYAPHVQAPANAQSFRAVWDVGNWEAGGMVIPSENPANPAPPTTATWPRPGSRATSCRSHSMTRPFERLAWRR